MSRKQWSTGLTSLDPELAELFYALPGQPSSCDTIRSKGQKPRQKNPAIPFSCRQRNPINQTNELSRIKPWVKANRAVAQTKISSSGSLRRALPIHLGESEDQRCQLFGPPRRRLLASSGASLRCIKNPLRTKGEEI